MNFEIGQKMLYKGDICNASSPGVIVAAYPVIGKVQVFSLAGGMQAMDNKVEVDVVLDDGRKFNRVSDYEFGGIEGNKSKRFMLIEGKVGEAEIAAAKHNADLAQWAREAQKRKEEEEFQAAKAAALAEGKQFGLIPVKDFQMLNKRGSAAAYNVRQHLKAVGIKASVKQSGSSIDVSVANEADRSNARVIARKYQAGNFNGMIDCYEYAKNPWGDAFGSINYVFVQ